MISVALENESKKSLIENLCRELSKRSGHKFIPEKVMHTNLPFHWLCVNISRDVKCFHHRPGEYEKYILRYPVKSPEGKELGMMYTEGDLYKIYFDAKRQIKWPDDWIDPHPASIDFIEVTDEYVVIEKGQDLDLDFISMAYYAIEFGPRQVNELLNILFINKENRMKLARFVPAVIKDFNIFLKLLDEIRARYGINGSEINLNVRALDCSLKFKITGMNNEEILDSILTRAEALTELRRKFREWLSSEERRNCYEKTMLFPEDPFRRCFHIPDVVDKSSGFSWKKYEGMRFLCKWPFKSGDDKVDKKYEQVLKHELWDAESFKYYDLDGLRLRLTKKTERGLRFLGRVNRKGWVIIDKAKVREEDLNREDIVIAVDERLEKLPKFPLEKIEFLQEDFPEMFKE
ncbi:MAG: hypothetical protein QXT54_04260 [Thermoplasmatales archaeon]|nr:hypothetical protein [Candidatus Bathyarchaeota archaeon]